MSKTRGARIGTAMTVGVLVVAGLLGVFILAKKGSGPGRAAQLPPDARQVTVYKSRTCGCCALYVDYLRDEGFTVAVVDTEDIAGVKDHYGIPAGLESCHTTIAAGYFVEGHVPVEALVALLAQKSAIRGIALPGMPSASPGMPGPKTEVWDVQAVGGDGQVSSFMRF